VCFRPLATCKKKEKRKRREEPVTRKKASTQKGGFVVVGTFLGSASGEASNGGTA